MKLSLALLLAMALTMSLFVGHGPGYASFLSWVWNRDPKPNVPEEQHPVESKILTSTQPCWFGLTSCPVRTEDRQKNQVVPKEQHPVQARILNSYWLCRLGLTSCPTWGEDGNKNQVLPKEQDAVETKILTSYWPWWLGPSQRPKWLRYRGSKVVVPEGTKQQSPGTKQKAMALTMSPFVGHDSGCAGWLSWLCNSNQKLNVPEEQHPVESKILTSTQPCWFGLTSCPIRIEDRQNNQVLPKEQHPVQAKILTSYWLCWFGLNTCPHNRNKNQVLPWDQDPVETKILTSHWPCWLGPSQCPKQVWYRGSKVPEGTKQQFPDTKWKVYSLPGILGQLWDYFVLGGRTWLITDALITFCIHRLWRKACGLWRRLRTGGQALPVPNREQTAHVFGQNARTSQKNELPCCPVMASKSKAGKTGLFNLGNTCYMNSVIQSLFMASDFRHSVLNLTEGNSWHLMMELQSLFTFLEHSQRPAISPESFLSASQPSWFSPGAQQDCSEYLKYLLNRLHEEEKTGKRIYYQQLKETSLMSQTMEHRSVNKTLVEKMFGGKMMTKIRCLKCLNISSREEAFTDLSLAFPPSDRPICRPGSTSALQEEEIGPQFIEPPKNQPTVSPWVRRKPAVSGDSGAQPVLVETLGFREPRETAHTTKDPDLASGEQTRAPKECLSVGDLINYFLSPERLTAENQYHCEKCASLQDAEKVAELTEAPHYLILTLLRFSFDPQTMTRSKILDNVSIPEVLQLPVLVSSEATEDICRHGKGRSDMSSTFVSAVYDLCSVVVHSGSSSESGHYYCYCRECTDTVPHAQPRDGTPKLASDEQLDFEIPWYLFNDHRVSTFSSESVSNLTSLYPKATAYVIFYRQRADRPSSSVHEAVAEARKLHSQPSLNKDLMKAISKDNILYLQEQEKGARNRAAYISTLPKSPLWWRDSERDKDDDSSSGGCSPADHQQPALQCQSTKETIPLYASLRNNETVGKQGSF
ncbi:LOW QUALITY PROTEIN: ubiquitin carboxyl-terminal hydrolase 35-like [Excalfactoria chinensis]|uniref:LOW QUALITY PROTEIN: ubiquitin carboxyl-terminal hydrolase 35-like n=1 Tax=Excalfactoria chinensis TaxID=46218 RepID=UPI003B3B2970